MLSEKRAQARVADIVALKDDRLVYRACSSAFAQLVGVASPDEVIGKTDFNLFSHAQSRSLMSQDSEAVFSANPNIGAVVLDATDSQDALQLEALQQESSHKETSRQELLWHESSRQVAVEPLPLQQESRQRALFRQALILRVPIRNDRQQICGLDIRLLGAKGAFQDQSEIIVDYQSMLNEAKQGSLIISGSKILFADDDAARVLGHTSVQALLSTSSVADILTHLELARVVAAVPAVQAAPCITSSQRLTLVASTHNKSQVRLVVRCANLQWGNKPALLLCFLDVALSGKPSSAKNAAKAKLASRGHAIKPVRPVTLQSDVLRRLQCNEQRYRHYAIAGADFFWEMDATLTIRVISEGFCRVLGISSEQVLGRKLSQVLSYPGNLNKPSHWKDHLRDLQLQKPFRDFEFQWSNAGKARVIRYSGIPVFNRSRQFVGYRGMGSDVTAAVRQAETTAYYANHDTLTGLSNRRSFETAVRLVLDGVRKRHETHVLCFMDLDNFKIVNDTCGHQAGDELLRQLTRLFGSLVRKSDVLARMGGDEFGILLYQCDVAEALKLGNQIRQEAENFVFVWEAKSFTIGVSIGIVIIDERWENMESLFNAADSTCYMAKNNGGNRVALYREEEEVFFDRKIAGHWIEHISSALKDNRLRMASQKILTLSDQPDGLRFEMLLRLEMPDGELISPVVFLPAAERYGLAAALDERALVLTLDWLSANPEMLDNARHVGLNFSASSCADSEFAQRILQIIDDSDVAPSKLCFCVSESAAIANLSTVSDFMEQLSAVGCRFCIDSFGAGLSSFAFLRKLPVEFLKIDGLLVKDILNDPTDYTMVKAICEISKSLGKQTVAECIESGELLEAVTQIGVDFGQGFHLGHPELITAGTAEAD